MRASIVLAALLGGCAVAPHYYEGQPEVNRRNSGVAGMTADQSQCYAQAVAAGAGVSNPSLVWQMAAQRETENTVYVACMRGKGLDVHGQPLTSSPASSPPG